MQFVLFLAAGSLEKLKEVWLFSRKKKRRKRRDSVRLVFWLGKGRKRKVKETGLEVEFVLGWKTERRVGAWFRKRRGSVETLRRVKGRAFVKVEERV